MLRALWLTLLHPAKPNAKPASTARNAGGDVGCENSSQLMHNHAQEERIKGAILRRLSNPSPPPGAIETDV
jgi:hypothetical protein